MAHKPVVLIIRDGWGIEPGGLEQASRIGDAPLLANTPVHDHLDSTAPMSRLSASGEDVGLPEGQMGNSEVGHLNLGAGRIVYQDLTRIDKCIREDKLAEIPALQTAFSQAKNSTLHFVGLVSDGGVHSHLNHVTALVDYAAAAGVERIAIHAITDGRDTSPTSGVGYLQQLETAIQGKAQIATVVGRYYAMDRDCRWERTQLAWDALVHGKGEVQTSSAAEALKQAYLADQTDEFIKPMVFSGAADSTIQDGDVVLFFNFRSDRGRQLSRAFLEQDFTEFERGAAPQVCYLTMTQYDATYDCPVLFEPVTLKNTLGEVVSQAGLTQLRIAETEKYPHVSYFFNGGNEVPFPKELRETIASPKVATYDLQPEMSCPEVTATLLSKLAEVDLVIVNFANPDMVGHTGDLQAAIRACEVVDTAVGQVMEATKALGGSLLITADHGNCEQMKEENGKPHTAHTTNLVQCWYVGPDQEDVTLQDGILADIAPTLLAMLEVAKPEEMSGKSLLIKDSSGKLD